MKNLNKKILSLVLALSLIISSNTFIFAESIYDVATPSNEVTTTTSATECNIPYNNTNLAGKTIDHDNLESVHDVIDIAMYGATVADFCNDLSFANGAWLAYDTVALLPIIPSSGTIRHGGKILVKAKEVGKAFRRAGRRLKNKIKSHIRVDKYITNIMNKLRGKTPRIDSHHIRKYHRNREMAFLRNKSQFYGGFDIEGEIIKAIHDNGSTVIRNPKNRFGKPRDGIVIIKQYKYPVGYRPSTGEKLYDLRFAVLPEKNNSEEFFIRTAFPDDFFK